MSCRCPVYDCLHKGEAMRRTELLQEVRKMRFEEILGVWNKRDITQEEVARKMAVSDRTFRRHMGRYEEDGLEGLKDSCTCSVIR